MKPKDIELLRKNKEAIVNALDVTTVLRDLEMEGGFSRKDIDKVLSDPRRRHRAKTFLTFLEKKPQTCYESFLKTLGNGYPHLYLLLRDSMDEEGTCEMVEVKINCDIGPVTL